MPFEHPDYKLGKAHPDWDRVEKILKFEAYVKHEELAEVIPTAYDWTHGIRDWGMLANDRLGICVIASAFHQVMAWAKATGRTSHLTEAMCIQDYSKFTGYDPSDPSTDQGTNLSTFMGQWLHQGLGYNHKLVAYMTLEAGNVKSVEQALYLFGGLTIGLNLPRSAANQVGSLWTVVGGPNGVPGSWGGHGVPLLRYAMGCKTCVTWAKTQVMTDGFLQKYCDEAYATVSQDFIDSSGRDPLGFDLQQMLADLARRRASA